MTLPSRAQSAFQGEGVRNLQEVRSFHCLQGTWGGQTDCLQVTTFLVLLMFLKRFCQKVEWAQDRTEGLQNILPRAQGGSSCQLSQVWTCRDFQKVFLLIEFLQPTETYFTRLILTCSSMHHHPLPQVQDCHKDNLSVAQRTLRGRWKCRGCKRRKV